MDERGLVGAAIDGDEAAFAALLVPNEPALRVHAYRMLGGLDDADDALQETRLKAWRHLRTYAPGTSFRAWLYRIATNTCLDRLRSRRRRVLPMDVGPPTDPGPPTTAPRTNVAWLDPYPDALLPDAALRTRETVRLAFVRAVQLLPPRQRAALLLHNVLDTPVAEVAGVLGTSAAAVNSLLQRARAAVAVPAPNPAGEELAADRLVAAWETGDFDALVAMLADDARLSMPPWPYWLDGRTSIAACFRHPGTWDGAPRPGRFRMLRTAINGQPAAMAYVGGAPICLNVLTVVAGRITEITVFVDPARFTAWGFDRAG